MILENDRAVLVQLLCVDEIPAALEAEYEIWQSMWHRTGGTGDMGPMLLIPLLRSLRMGKAKAEQPQGKIDWTLYPQDGTVRVEARYMGQWMPGKFIGFVEHGILALRLDDDPMVRECRPDMVRLSVDQSPRATDDEVSPAAKLLDVPIAPESVPDEVLEDDMPDTDVEPDIGALPAGAEVYVEDGPDTLDAELVGPADEPGMFKVKVDGVERVVSGSLLTPA